MTSTHLHLQDSPDLTFAEGIPMLFCDYIADGQRVSCGIPTGGMCRQMIMNAE